MTVRHAVLAVLVAGVLCSAAAAAVFVGEGELGEIDPVRDQRAVAAAERFLDEYVDDDGRVVRRDEGGDTVSEGQAYALLAAVAIGDEATFARVWEWTEDEILRPDGAMSWMWADGRVGDPQPATDADLDAARALALAGDRFSEPQYALASARMARAVLETMSVAADDDRRILLAGPWARGSRIVNPSYLSPQSYAVLDEARPDDRWRTLAEDARLVSRDLLAIAPFLPPDWARVRDGGEVVPMSPPSRDDLEPRFGLDAQRLPIRFAESCLPDDREVAARVWPFLRDRLDADGLRQSWDLRGRPTGDAPHPLTFVSAAAAAGAGDDAQRRGELLDRAEQAQADGPSYYGGAWVALGRLMLETNRLGGCPVV